MDFGLGIFFQPSEFCKYMLVIYLAHFLFKKEDKMDNFWVGIFLPCLPVVPTWDLFWPGRTSEPLSSFWQFFHNALCRRSKAPVPAQHRDRVCGTARIGYHQRGLQNGENNVLSWTRGKTPLGSGYQAVQSFMAFGLGGLYGRRARKQFPEAAFPSPGPHGFYLFDNRRGIRIHRGNNINRAFPHDSGKVRKDIHAVGRFFLEIHGIRFHGAHNAPGST